MCDNAQHQRRGGTCRGFVMADVVLGMAILAVLAAAFFVSVHKQRRGAERLADMRGAAWDAEYALAAMQSGGKPSEDVQVERLAEADGAAGAANVVPDGYAWVRVSAQRNGRAASLIGLVPRDAVAEGGKP